jgi:probable HAF family extracellular repeat protein
MSMSTLRLGGVLVAALAALSGCALEAEPREEVGTEQQALGSTCVRDGDCASGLVCWTSGASCVRASSCYSGSTGPGVFVGSLTVDAADTAADLQSVGNAWCVTGDVTVKKTSLIDLNGLGGLLTVAGTVSIEDNPALRSLEGLNGLRRTMKVALFRNTSLASLAALSKLTTLSSLQVYINPALTDLGGLQNVTGTSWIEVVNNAGLTSLTGLDSITTAYSYIDVRQNPRLTSLAGLGSLASVGNLVQVMDNPQLQSLQGLGELATIGNTLRVMRNPELDDLKGLAKLTRSRTFQVSDNAQLDSCNVTALAASAAADCSGCLRNGPCPPADNCPADPNKLEPGLCGCGVADTDSDGDGAADCVDPCPSDNPNDTDLDGVCQSQDQCDGFDDHVDADQNGKPDGCQECVVDLDCDDGNARSIDVCSATFCVSSPVDDCPEDPAKLEPGVCGCGIADVDTDADGALDCQDACPGDNPNDSDLDGVCDSQDQCAGFDDRVDVDVNGIPDGCQACVTAAQCNDGNPCTSDTCTATVCAHTANVGASCGDQGKCSTTAECIEPRCKFEPLGFLTTYPRESIAFAVSDDGRTVAGRARYGTSSSLYQGFRWTAENGMVGLSRAFTFSGTGISGDGSRIAGNLNNELSPTPWAFRETATSFETATNMVVTDLSGDGKVAVGYSKEYAMRWVEGQLPAKINSGIYSIALGVSRDGTVVVGRGKVSSSPFPDASQAFVWTPTGTIGLGDFRSSWTVQSDALAVSPNGRIVVGTALAADGSTHGFRWTQESGLVSLGRGYVPEAVTDDGIILTPSAVLGSSLGSGNIKGLLTDCGLDLRDWNLSAYDISADGKAIVGEARYFPTGEYQAFLARLP